MGEVASAFVSLLPSAKGFGSKLTSQVSGDVGKSGGVLGGLLGKTMLAGFVAAGVVAGVGKALYDIGSEFDDVSDTIRVSTGKSGAALQALDDVAKNVGRNVPVSFDQIGPVVADLNKRLGLTGKPLQKLSEQFLDLGHITGQAVDTQAVSGALNLFNVKSGDASKVMDQLFRVSQSTGIGFNDLTSSLQRNGPTLSQFGFSISQSASLIGTLSKAGLDSNKTLGTLSHAMATFAKDGKDPQKALQGTIKQIQGFIDKGDQAGAVNLAAKVFGTRGATQFVAALRSGRVNMQSLTDATKGNHDTIIKATKDTADFAEKWQEFKNRVLIALEPIATRVFGAFSSGATKALPLVTRFVNQMQAGTGQGGQFAANLRSVGAILARLGAAALRATGYLNQHRGILVALAAAYVAYKGILLGVAIALKVQAANEAISAAAEKAHAAITALSKGTLATRIGVLYIDAAAWVRSTASTVASTVATTANTVVTKLSNLNLGTRIGLLAGSVAAWVASTASTIANTVATVASTIAQKAAALASKAWAVAQWLLNAALDANPIGLVVVGIAALIAGLVIAYKHSEKFRAVVDATFSFLKKFVPQAISAVVGFVKNHWGLLVSIIGGPLGIIVVQVIKHFGTIKSTVSAAASFVLRQAKTFAQFAANVISDVGQVVAFFKKLPGKITGFFKGLPGQLSKIGGQLISGLVSGITGSVHLVWDEIKKIANGLPGWFKKLWHIHSPSGVTADIGDDVMRGLALGIERSAGTVQKAAEKATGKIIKTLRGKLKDLQSTFQGLVDPIAQAFTGDLFSATSASSFIASLTATKGTLTNLTSAFKTLLGWGLSPGFLSQLFQSGNSALILSLAAAGKDQASAAASTFGDVMSLSDQLGSSVAGATDQGKAIEKQTAKLEAKLDHLIKAGNHNARMIADAVSKPAANARRRARAA